MSSISNDTFSLQKNEVEGEVTGLGSSMCMCSLPIKKDTFVIVKIFLTTNALLFFKLPEP